MTENTKGWIVEAFNGVNIVTVLVAVVAIVFTFSQMQSSSETRMTVLEKTFVDLTQQLDDLENSLDQMGTTETKIAIIELDAKNVRSFVDRNEAKVDAVQEALRVMQARIRDLENSAK